MGTAVVSGGKKSEKKGGVPSSNGAKILDPWSELLLY